LFFYDFDQNEQFEFIYQKHLLDNSVRGKEDQGGLIAKLS